MHMPMSFFAEWLAGESVPWFAVAASLRPSHHSVGAEGPALHCTAVLPPLRSTSTPSRAAEERAPPPPPYPHAA